MSADSVISFEQGECNYKHCESSLMPMPSSSAFAFTSNPKESYSGRIASCSNSMKYHSSDTSDEEEQICKLKTEQENEMILDNKFEPIESCLKSMEYHSSDTSDGEVQMEIEQEENEMVLNGQFKPIESCSKSMKYNSLDTSDEDEQIDNMQYPLETSDEEEQIDHMLTKQNGNNMDLNGTFKPIASCSKSMKYNSVETSDEEERINYIPTRHEGNEMVLDELDSRFVQNDLPAGWKKINHDSGMPIYLNEDMKVCTFSKPYYLGTQSLKNHNIPVANIPCLDYKLRLQKMKILNSGGELEDSKGKLTPEEYKNYCKAIFKFKSIKFMRFSSWDKRREYIRMIKADRRRRDLPKFKDKSRLIAVPVQPPVLESTVQSEMDEWIINLNNKSYVSILHEYIQRVLKTQPAYIFKELENARYPYLATVILDGMQYGIGIGSSKKQAKLDSARATLEILLPSVKDQIKINRKQGLNDNYQVSNVFNGDIVFDKLKIKDSRIPEFCAQAAESMPYDMLQICVKRNFGEDVKVKSEMQSMQSSTDSVIFYRLTMKVKEHSATVICKNKRDGRQKGAQALLKVLHPHIKYFGSLLRLYSHQNVGSSSEKKLDEPGIQSPQPRGCANQVILNQLKQEMSKLEN